MGKRGGGCASWWIILWFNGGRGGISRGEKKVEMGKGRRRLCGDGKGRKNMVRGVLFH